MQSLLLERTYDFGLERRRGQNKWHLCVALLLSTWECFLLYYAVSFLCPGNKHDDGTQSDSENAGAHRRCSKRATLEEHLRRHHSEQKKLQKAQATDKHPDQTVVSQTTFMIAFFDEDNPRKRRSYSFTQSAGILCEEAAYSAPHTKLAKPKSPTADAKVVSLSLQTSSAHHRGGHGVPHGKLLKQKSEEPSVPIPFLQTALLRSSGSLGHRPSQDMDKMLKNQAPSATPGKDNDDDQSDKGTYTIELENPNSEEMEARQMIDKVNKGNVGVLLVFVGWLWLSATVGESA